MGASFTWNFYREGGALLFFGGISFLIYYFLANPPAVPTDLGPRGFERAATLARSPMFRLAAPMIAHFAGWLAYFPLGKLRSHLQVRLAYAGHWLGLSPDEFLGVCVLSGLGGVGLGVLLSAAGDAGPAV